MKSKIALVSSFLIILIVAVSLFFILFHKPPSADFPRLIILGIDGAGWNFMNPLLEKNSLPNLKFLIENGSSGTLTTIRPTESAVIWTSIATGKSMIKHGIVNFTYLKKNNVAVPFRQSERRARAFWNILSDKKRTVGVINWFITFPAEEVNGFMVSEEFRHLGRRNFEGAEVTYPRDLLKTLQFAKTSGYPKALKETMLPDYRLANPKGKLSANFPNFLFQDRTVEAASYYLFEKYPVEVFAAYFRLVDVVSHFACIEINSKLLEKGMEEEKKGEVSRATLDEIDGAFSRILEPVYAYMDRIVGRFLEMAPPDATFIIVSDHAFEFHNGGYGHTDTRGIPHGIIILKGPDIRKNLRLEKAHIYDVLPTLLFLSGLPVAKDMDGKVRTEAIDPGLLKKRKIRSIPTYEGASPKKKGGRNKELDKKLLEELRALGYIQ